MSTLKAVQSASKTVILNAIRARKITSPDEEYHNSESYSLIVPLKEILNININENLRSEYNRKTQVHKDIAESFNENPLRFIQRHSGFVVVCDKVNISDHQKNGKSRVELINASLINGAQSQSVLKQFIETVDDPLFHNRCVRLEVLQEANKEERINIAIARNMSVNVTELSKYGKMKYFDKLEAAMINALGADGKIQKSETDDGIPTLQLLQVLRVMMPKKIREQNVAYTNTITKAYTSKSVTMRDFCREHEKDKKAQNLSCYTTDILEYYRTFAPHAWQQYIYFKEHPLWKDYWLRDTFEGQWKKIGQLNKNDGTVEANWAILCPLLYGLSTYVKPSISGWSFKPDKTFSEKAYIKEVLRLFKLKDFVPNEFGKGRDSYLDLYIYLNENM